jgi:hypothetical protein
MSYFLKSGNTFRVSSKEALDLHDLLPAGKYGLKHWKKFTVMGN